MTGEPTAATPCDHAKCLSQKNLLLSLLRLQTMPAVLPQRHKYLDAESEFTSPAVAASPPYQPPARGTPVEQNPSYSTYQGSNGYTPSSPVPAMANGKLRSDTSLWDLEAGHLPSNLLCYSRIWGTSCQHRNLASLVLQTLGALRPAEACAGGHVLLIDLPAFKLRTYNILDKQAS